uniref:transposase n=1 Tax=Paenibacillus nasutitermitis TaxID=1652958 RepID=UPI00166E97B3|nr:transposase [Paenibacillus nasutitermitis]
MKFKSQDKQNQLIEKLPPSIWSSGSTSPSKRTSLAGLHLGEDSSGKHKGQVRITKRGRSGLRKFLYLAVVHLVVNNEEFRTLHHYYTRTKKMKKVHSIIKLCGKLARILVGIVRQEQTYIPEKVVTATTAA